MSKYFYGFHKDSTDLNNLIPSEFKNRALELEVLEENNHHWTFKIKNEDLKFTVVKFPMKLRGKAIPPFSSKAKVDEYLAHSIPTFDKDGERL